MAHHHQRQPALCIFRLHVLILQNIILHSFSVYCSVPHVSLHFKLYIKYIDSTCMHVHISSSNRARYKHLCILYTFIYIYVLHKFKHHEFEIQLSYPQKLQLLTKTTLFMTFLPPSPLVNLCEPLKSLI
jgi:hypothetical protein